jgi:hypothetical protein
LLLKVEWESSTGIILLFDILDSKIFLAVQYINAEIFLAFIALTFEKFAKSSRVATRQPLVIRNRHSCTQAHET